MSSILVTLLEKEFKISILCFNYVISYWLIDFSVWHMLTQVSDSFEQALIDFCKLIEKEIARTPPPKNNAISSAQQERGSSSTVDATASTNVLNEDVISIIISSLPAVSLLRFLSVCKNWEAMIRTLLTSRTQGVRFLLPVAPPFHSVDVGNHLPPYTLIRHESFIRGYETLIAGLSMISYW